MRVNRLLGMASTRWICAAWVWRLEGGVTKEGVDRGEAQITAANAHALTLLQVIQKRHDQRGIDLLEVQA